MWSKRGSCFSPEVPTWIMDLNVYRDSMWWNGQSSGRLALATWLGQVTLLLGASVCSTTNTKIPNSHKRGLLGIRTWLPHVTSPRKAFTQIYSLFCPH